MPSTPDTAEAPSLQQQLDEERRRRQVAEAQLDRRYERLSEDPGADYFIYAADADSLLTYVSPSVERILGYNPVNLIGRNWRAFADQQSWSFATAEANEAEVLQGADSPTKLIEVRRSDGKSVLVEVSPRPLFGDHGVVIGHEGLCRVASDYPETQVKLRAVSDELEVSIRRRTAELEYRIEFEKLLVSLSTGFIGLEAERFADEITDSLQRVGEFIGVDRCSISLLGVKLGSDKLTYEWNGANAVTFERFVRTLPDDLFRWEVSQLATGRLFVFDQVEHAPEEARGFRTIYKNFDVRSALHFPMIIGDRLMGMMSCATVGREFRWQQEHIDLVRVLGEVVANTLERLDSQTLLARSEQRLQEIVRDQTEMIIRWTPERGHLFINDAVCRFLGKPADQIIGADVLGHIHRDDLASVREKLASLTPEAPLAVDEHRVVRADGSTAWYQWVDRALFDRQGRFTEYQSVGRDITGLKRTQEELERRLQYEELVLRISARLINPPIDRREEILNGVLQEIGEFTGADRAFMYLIDADKKEAHLRSCWSSPAAPPVLDGVEVIPLAMMPWTEQEIRDGVPLHVPSIDTLPQTASKFHDSLERMHTKTFVNVPMVSDDGMTGYLGFASHYEERTWTEDEISLLRLIGEILMSLMARDAAERALQESRELLRLTIEGVEEGVYDWNIEEGRVVVSDHWLRTLGLPPGENTRSEDDWRDRIHPDDWDQTEHALQQHFSGATPVYEAEYRIRHSNGQYRWNLNRGRVIQRSETGRPLRMVGVDRDITDMIEARDKRRVLESQLAHLGRVATMGETVAGIAHEVNQPLHAAATFNAAARSALASGKQEKAESLFQKSSEQICRAGDIIRRMREYTRPRQTDITTLDLNALLRRSAEFVMGYNTHARTAISFELADNLPAVQGDAVQLQQVAVNLIQNGVDSIRDAGVEDGQIVISTWAEGHDVVARFVDNGKGAEFDPDDLFDAFFSTKPNGMGIGLALCRRIVETHNGSIQAVNNESAGMTFTIRIPAPEVVKR